MKVCQFCGITFVGRGIMFCSISCRGAYRRKRVLRNCQNCKKEFETYPYLIKQGYGRFCSLKCKGITQLGRRTKDNRNCFICKKSFYKTQKQVEKGKGKFCSSNCYHKSTKGKPAHNKGMPMSEGQKLKLSERNRGKRLGKESYAWKGGITPIYKKMRESFEYKAWRKIIFKRDNWTCIWCKERGGILHADHIRPFAWYPALRLVLSNGQTLCKNCHSWKTKIDLKIYKSLAP